MPTLHAAELQRHLHAESEQPAPALKPCSECKAPAVWVYMPGGDDQIYCDKHVPRGCSCNIADSDDPSSTEQLLDDQDRPWPCVEYWHFPEGVDNEPSA